MDSFGAKLKREREKRKISLDDVSAATKISNRFLSAIETDRFEQLPGGIFNRGFIRAYARHLGLDEDQTITDYLAAAGEDDPNIPNQPEISQNARMEETPSSAELPWMEIVALLLLVIVGIALWRFHERESKPSHSSDKREAPLQAVTAKEATSTPVKDLQRPVTPALDKLASAQTESNTNGQVFQLRIVAREDSWISVNGPQGEIFHQVISPPEEKSFTTRNRIVVKAGNVGGLDFFWNGRAIASQGKEGEVKTLIFDGSGVHSPSPLPATAN